jgi:tetratricopeptide (TPR) repeat protein
MRRLLVCALLLCGCHQVPPRLIHIQVAVGPGLRQQAKWREIVTSRIGAASEMFRPLNLRFEMAGISEWEPDPKLPPESTRWSLAGFHSSGDWIDLGFYGSAQQASEPGLAVPFDPRVLVYDISGGTEERQTAALAHELGHVFGAWHDQEGGSVMSLPPGEKLDDATLSLVNATRTIDFRQGALSLSDDAVARIQKVWSKSKGDPSGNPLFRFYSSLGTEAYRRGLRVDAEENFNKAVKFGPEVVRAHIDLGNSRLTNREYSAAADEFRKVLKVEPHSAPALSGLAAAQVGAGHRDEAMQTLAQSVRLNPADPSAHANMGVVLVSTPGRLDDGIAELREALRMDPNSQSIKRSLDAALDAKSKGRK